MTSIPDWLAPLYPFTPQAFRTPGGAQMSYLDEGDRAAPEAVLMLHGNPTWSFYYRDLVQRLAPRLRCIAPDHIGTRWRNASTTSWRSSPTSG
jgi:cis-3-alkyl-4-acyloxetan-2-one decarboxylase